MKTEYKIIEGYTMWGITRTINKHLEKGWELQGGINRMWFTFYQAIIKKGE